MSVNKCIINFKLKVITITHYLKYFFLYIYITAEVSTVNFYCTWHRALLSDMCLTSGCKSFPEILHNFVMYFFEETNNEKQKPHY